MALETELATYRQKLPELLQHSGRFVLIHANDVIDVYTSYDDAIKEGYKRFSLDPFLVQQVEQIETIAHVTRRVLPHAEQKAS